MMYSQLHPGLSICGACVALCPCARGGFLSFQVSVTFLTRISMFLCVLRSE